MKTTTKSKPAPPPAPHRYQRSRYWFIDCYGAPVPRTVDDFTEDHDCGHDPMPLAEAVTFFGVDADILTRLWESICGPGNSGINPWISAVQSPGVARLLAAIVPHLGNIPPEAYLRAAIMTFQCLETDSQLSEIHATYEADLRPAGDLQPPAL